MINATFTKPQSKLEYLPQKMILASFLENSPSGYAVFDLKQEKIIFFNEAFLQLLHCEPFALKEAFPNLSLLRIQDSLFAERWQSQLRVLEEKGHTYLECPVKSVYGEKIMLKWELWLMSNSESHCCVIKVEDITKVKKLTQEAKKYVKII